MKLQKFHKIIADTPEDVKEDVRLSMDILDRLHELLNEKFDGKQHLLAQKLNKSESEISKWFSGVQNFTTKTLSKLQVAFGEPIIAVCTNNDNSTFTQVKIPYKRQHTILNVTKDGNIKEEKVQFESIKKIKTTKKSLNNPLI